MARGGVSSGNSKQLTAIAFRFTRHSSRLIESGRRDRSSRGRRGDHARRLETLLSPGLPRVGETREGGLGVRADDRTTSSCRRAMPAGAACARRRNLKADPKRSREIGLPTFDTAVRRVGARCVNCVASRSRRAVLDGRGRHQESRKEEDGRPCPRAVAQRHRGDSSPLREIRPLPHSISRARARDRADHGRVGPGKAVVAKAIHEQRPRSGQPFLMSTSLTSLRAFGVEPVRPHARRVHRRVGAKGLFEVAEAVDIS